jgi:uncharacterized protein YbjT (DUF2867 family)
LAAIPGAPNDRRDRRNGTHRATEMLLAKGEKVRAVGRDAKKLAPLVELGAEPFVGNVEDVDSMTNAFDSA